MTRTAVNRLITLTVGVVVGTLTLSGCSEEGGLASPATTGPVVSESSEVASGDPFDGIDRCVILDKALEGRGLPAGKVSTVVREKGCDVSKPKYVSIGFVLDSDASYDEVQADPTEVFDGKVNGRPAVLIKFRHVERDCAISMQVTEQSYAFLTAGMYDRSTTRAEICDFVTKVMQKIEPQLPKG